MSFHGRTELQRLLYWWFRRFLLNMKSIKSIIDCIPGALSQMSHRGTSLGSASPTRTCRLASLLHICTCHTNYLSQTYFTQLQLASTLWIGNLDLASKKLKGATAISHSCIYSYQPLANKCLIAEQNLDKYLSIYLTKDYYVILDISIWYINQKCYLFHFSVDS